MKVRLLNPDRSFVAAKELPPQTVQVAEDLAMGSMLKVMAGGDDYLWQISKAVLFQPLADPQAIRHRQRVLEDCINHPDSVRQLYDVAVDALAVEKGLLWHWKSDNPSRDIYRSRNCLADYAERLRTLRSLADEVLEVFTSPGLRTLCGEIRDQLPEDYLDRIDRELARLRFPGGVEETLRLGRANEGIDHVLRSPNPPSGLIERLGLDRNRHTVTVPARDMAGLDALAELKDHGLARAAAVLADSVDHVKAYFQALRQDLAWYLACLNLHTALVDAGMPTTLPDPHEHGDCGTLAQRLYDPMLVVHGIRHPTTSNLDGHDAQLIVITGANQGGKSTFLRALGLAQLMMQAGMFVAAESFSAEVAHGVYTHFKREEDPSMTSGKFDEELTRMSTIVDQAKPGSLVLCNESFSSTNEREAALVGGDVVQGLLDAGVRVRLVTHLYEFAERLEREVEGSVLLRADRHDDGTRSHEIVPGQPLSTSYGGDLYTEVFGQPWPAAGVPSAT